MKVLDVLDELVDDLMSMMPLDDIYMINEHYKHQITLQFTKNMKNIHGSSSNPKIINSRTSFNFHQINQCNQQCRIYRDQIKQLQSSICTNLSRTIRNQTNPLWTLTPNSCKTSIKPRKHVEILLVMS